MATVPTQEEKDRRLRRSLLNKFQKLADTDKDGRLTVEEGGQAKLFEQNWTQLGLRTPEPSVYGDDVPSAPTPASEPTGAPTDLPVEPYTGPISAASFTYVPKTTFMGVPLPFGTEFGTNAGYCRRWTLAEKRIIQQHMKYKKVLEKRWAEKYMCQPTMKTKCMYV